jgi:hypothetical protein
MLLCCSSQPHFADLINTSWTDTLAVVCNVRYLKATINQDPPGDLDFNSHATLTNTCLHFDLFGIVAADWQGQQPYAYSRNLIQQAAASQHHCHGSTLPLMLSQAWTCRHISTVQVAHCYKSHEMPAVIIISNGMHTM